MTESGDPRFDRPALPMLGTAPALERSGPRALRVPDPLTIYGSAVAPPTHLREHWRVLLRHRWLVLGFLVLTVAATAAWTFTTRPLFLSTAVLRIEKDEPRVVKFEDVLKADTAEDYYQTQYQLLRSRSLAGTVIARLGLQNHPEFRDDGDWVDKIQGWVRRQLDRLATAPPAVVPGAAKDLAVASPVTDAFLRHVAIDPTRNSRLVTVGFESHHPDLAARVTNALADAFIAGQLEAKAETTRYARDFLGRQLDDAGAKLKDAETRLNGFLKANNIFFLNPDKADEQRELITQQMTQLSDALLKARADRIAKESLYRHAVASAREGLPPVLASPLVRQLKEELAKAEAEYSRLGQTFKPEYPRMEQLQRAIVEFRSQLGAETRRILNGVEHEYQTAVGTERELQQALNGQQQLARRLGDQMPEYSVLRRDVDTNRQLYTSLLTRLKETQISSALITSNISVVDRGEIPRSPYRPRKTLNLLLGVIVGLVGGAGLAFLVEYFDTTVRDPSEIEETLSVPAIGVVPSAAGGVRALLAAPFADTIPGQPIIAAGREHDAEFADAFRTVRTTLLYRAVQRAPTTFMVTSPQRGEGKTTVATNLGVVLAKHGTGDVLLVDADLYRPAVHTIFGTPAAPGLAEVLGGERDLADVIAPTATPNLYVIPAGRTSSRLADLLASPHLGPMLDAVTGRFKHIVFDTTPLLGISDALSLAPHVGGVLLVLRHGHAPRVAVWRAVQLLDSVRTPFLGVVLNRFDARNAGAGYYGQAGYPYAASSVSR